MGRPSGEAGAGGGLFPRLVTAMSGQSRLAAFG